MEDWEKSETLYRPECHSSALPTIPFYWLDPDFTVGRLANNEKQIRKALKHPRMFDDAIRTIKGIWKGTSTT